MERYMDTYRKNATAAGILFILETAAGIIAVPLTSVMENADYLVKAALNQNTVLTGALLQLLMSFFCAGIAYALYPVLKKQNPALSIGAVGFRTIEAVFHIISAVIVVSILTLSMEYAASGSGDKTVFTTAGTALLSIKSTSSNIGLMAWHTGAFIYYLIFLRSKLIPSWLSIWGLVSIIITFASSILLMYSLLNQMSLIHTLLNLPIAVQEMFLAVWLIAKGFNHEQ
jgi:hypothetical protein